MLNNGIIDPARSQLLPQYARINRILVIELNERSAREIQSKIQLENKQRNNTTQYEQAGQDNRNFPYSEEIKFGFFSNKFHCVNLDRDRFQFPAAKPEIGNSTADHDGSKHGRQNTDTKRDSETLDWACSEIEQRNTGDQGRYV